MNQERNTKAPTPKTGAEAERRVRLSSRRWLLLFAVTLLLLALLIPLFNLVTDPYGAFGDRFLQWWSYDMTLNPKLAKMRYLEQHHENYDSYIVGSSGSSGLDIEALNRALDAKFYNCFFYGTNTRDFEEIAVWLLEQYPMKNLVLNVSMMIASAYDGQSTALSKLQYWKVEGSSPLTYYARYLTVSPAEGLQKLEQWRKQGYLMDAYRVMLPETGAYDKSRRDVEGIGSLGDYLSRPAYDAFNHYPQRSYRTVHLEQAMQTVTRIRDLCQEKGVRLLVICQPSYYKDYQRFDPADRPEFYNALAQVTDYWDFTLSSLSWDPRYFYDETHFRNALGSMVAARIFGDDSLWMPADFGRYVARGSTPGAPSCEPIPTADYCAELPILRYHHLVEEGEAGGTVLSAAAFAAQMDALEAAGYTTVDIWQLRDYVERGTALPEKPVMITFDDGYESNYSIAYPILQAHGFKATIFAIGVSMGKDTYKDTGAAMLPHFSLEQAAEMTASGLITVASHGYDVHEVPGLDPEPVRPGPLMREGETEAEYVDFLTRDAQRMRELLGEAGGFFSYPTSRHDERCLVILSRAGVFATVCGDGPCATLIRGLPQCLYDMPRLLVTEDMSGEALLAAMETPSPDVPRP